MDSLMDILGGRDFDEPSEISAIKKFVQDEYNIKPTVAKSGDSIVITLPNASMVSSVRLRGPEIKRRCQIDKKLIFRIG